GLIQASGSIGTTPLDPGGTLSPLQFSSGLQVEQITALQGFSQTSAASAQMGGASASAIGPVDVTSGADTDPAQPGHDYDSKTSTAALTGGPLSLTGDGGSVSLSASGTDSLATTSTTSASVSPSHLCANVSGTNQTDGQPCGNSKVTPGVAIATALP